MIDVKHVAVIGSGNNLDRKIQEIAEYLGKKLIDCGFRILFGGLGGVIQAVCKGARASKNYKEGMTVCMLPSLKKSDANPSVD